MVFCNYGIANRILLRRESDPRLFRIWARIEGIKLAASDGLVGTQAAKDLAQPPEVMPKLDTLSKLLESEIKDLYSAETQLVKALSKMADAASSAELADAFTTHLKETKVQVTRLEQAAGLLGITPRGKTCTAMKGLLTEGEEVIGEDGDPAIKDLALITAAQKIEHYEIAGYGSARATASLLGHEEVMDLLTLSLDEEEDTDMALTALAEDIGEAISNEEE